MILHAPSPAVADLDGPPEWVRDDEEADYRRLSGYPGSEGDEWTGTHRGRHVEYRLSGGVVWRRESAPVAPSVVSVVPVVSEDGEALSPTAAVTMRGTLGLCPAQNDAVVSVAFGGSDSRSTASEASGASAEDSDKTTEALALLAAVGTDEDPYKSGGPWAYADGENCGGRVFFVTQNLKTDAGAHLIDSEQVERAVERKGMTRWAWILHDKDVYTAEEAKKNPRAVEGQPKADHFHVAIERKSFATVGVVARAFGVPPQQVEVKPAGAFLDLVEYLTHENPNQQAKGKHLYADEEVHANFEWRAGVDDNKLARSFKAGQRASVRKTEQVCLAVMHGEATLRQVRLEEPTIYYRNLEKLTRLRHDFLLNQPPPRRRTNYFIGGKEGLDRTGRTGKTALAKLHARMLYPDLEASECYHVATDKRVPLQTYRGQPVIIWDDFNALDLMDALGGRSGVWQVFDDHPSASDVNIKGSSTRLVHEVNLVTKTTPYRRFLDALAGQYTSKDGVLHLAEDRNQSWGRFPMVFEVTVESIELLLNRGFATDTDDFLAYQTVARMRASMKRVMESLDSIEDDEEREAATFAIGETLLRPILDQHHALTPKANRLGPEVVAEVLGDIEVLDRDACMAEDARVLAEIESAKRLEIEAAKQAAVDATAKHGDARFGRVVLDGVEQLIDAEGRLCDEAGRPRVSDDFPYLGPEARTYFPTQAIQTERNQS